MLADIYNSLQGVISFIGLLFNTAVDFFSSIPKFLNFVTDLFAGVPACLVGFCGVALSLLLANKILNLI